MHYAKGGITVIIQPQFLLDFVQKPDYFGMPYQGKENPPLYFIRLNNLLLQQYQFVS